MKILQLIEERQIDIGDYGPACEGFIDKLKAFIFTGTGEEKANRLNSSNGHRIREVGKDLDRDLRRTYGNPEWRKKLPTEERRVNAKLLGSANVDGKAITAPKELATAAERMMAVARKIYQQEKPHFELRQSLVAKIRRLDGKPEEIDKLWLQYKEQLKVKPAERYVRAGGKPQPALGFDTKNPKAQWPVRGSGEEGYNVYTSVTTPGEFITVTQANADEFVDAITELAKLIEECNKLSAESHIADGDDMPVDMDELKYGESIFTEICSSQSYVELSDMLWRLESEFCRLVGGLYILMFGKQSSETAQ